MELRELRSSDAGYARELKQRADEIEELNQVLLIRPVNSIISLRKIKVG